MPVADHLRPAAIEAGVILKPGQRFGFHNLRHSLSSLPIAGQKSDDSGHSPPWQFRDDN
jgi:hypothetical protein